MNHAATLPEARVTRRWPFMPLEVVGYRWGTWSPDHITTLVPTVINGRYRGIYGYCADLGGKRNRCPELIQQGLRSMRELRVRLNKY